MAEAAPKIRLFVDGRPRPRRRGRCSRPEQAHYLFNVMRARPRRRGRGLQRPRRRVARPRSPAPAALGGARRLPRPRPAAAPPARPLAGLRPDQEGAHRLHRREGGRARRRRACQPVFTRSPPPGASAPTACAPTPSRRPSSAARPASSRSPRPVRLDALLDGWDPARRLMFCDEIRVGPAAPAAAPRSPPPPRPLGDPDRPRGRLRARGGGAPARAPLRAAGDPRPARPARRHRRRRRARPLAGTARRLAMTPRLRSPNILGGELAAGQEGAEGPLPPAPRRAARAESPR